MDTLVTIQLAVPAAAAQAWAGPVARAFGWFAAVEAACSRFDPASEVSQLAHQVGRQVPASPLLFEALQLGIALADVTGGAFDPAIGYRMEAAGYDRDYRTGRRRRSGIHPAARPTYRDVVLDPDRHTVTLRRAVLLDLGGLAKGLAVDLAARALQSAPGAVVDAGGDVYAQGTDRDDRCWQVGVADPRHRGALLATIEVTNGAVASSGTYVRGDHLLDPRRAVATREEQPMAVTVLAPTAVLADALSTAAAVLGETAGRALLDDIDQVEGLLVTADGELAMTDGFPVDALTSPETGAS
jgi:thiamine biosynthesis lipoprotein